MHASHQEQAVVFEHHGARQGGDVEGEGAEHGRGQRRRVGPAPGDRRGPVRGGPAAGAEAGPAVGVRRRAPGVGTGFLRFAVIDVAQTGA